MKLAQLLDGVHVIKMFQTTFGQMATTHDVEVNTIHYDSRKIGQNDCFVAIRGTGVDAHTYIGAAINQGAKVVVLENDAVLPDSYFMHAGVIKIVVPDSRKALATMAANFFGHPSKRMTLVGVTGTNGKTTTTHLVRSVLEAAGKKAGMIGTIEYWIGDEVIPATHTTPESLELNELFSTMLAKGCSAVAMEVSSHALSQSRVFGLDFDAAVFTNLTQDHLDYHGTMEAYAEAKKILFDSLKPNAHAVVNADDPWGKKIVASSAAAKLTYSIQQAADLQAINVNLRIERTSFEVVKKNETSTVSSPLVGRFNVYNMLAAYGAGVALGIPGDVIRRGIENVASVRGRFEKVRSAKGWTAIIDYAHTPDALEKCLRTIHDVLPKQNRGTIITVFGAGGDRDKTKRPLMGKIAAELSDVVVVTSDNPRTEDPERILEDIIDGMPEGCAYIREVDRRTAIQKAVQRAKSGDVVLIAGKGHEDYQVLGTTKIHFSDREIVEELALKAA